MFVVVYVCASVYVCVCVWERERLDSRRSNGANLYEVSIHSD